MRTYTMIRSAAQEARCTQRTSFGSPMYCTCGCQTPRDTDPQLDTVLVGVTVGARDEDGYANVALMHDGRRVGYVDTQYSYLCIEGVEYVGCKGIDDLLAVARAVPRHTEAQTGQSGDTVEDTAAAEHRAEAVDSADMDTRHKGESGWCNKCHSHCYGDCEA